MGRSMAYGSLLTKRKSRTFLLWCLVFKTCITAPPIFVQPVLDLGANISWKQHLLITVWIVFYLLKIDLYLDTLDQTVILCFLDKFCVCFKFPLASTFKLDIDCILLFIHKCSWWMQTFGYFLTKLKMFCIRLSKGTGQASLSEDNSLSYCIH